MESKMTMELVLQKKKGERSVVVEQKHNLRFNSDQNIVVTKPNYGALNLCKLSINGREDNFKRCNRKPVTSSHTLSKIIFSALPLLSLSLFVMLLNLTEDANASPYIGNNCILNPQLAVDPNEAVNCVYGFEVDACGTHFCSKGPKSYCGGRFERYGICGEGLMCNKCNRCTGCSTKTFECWYDDNCIWSSD